MKKLNCWTMSGKSLPLRSAHMLGLSLNVNSLRGCRRLASRRIIHMNVIKWYLFVTNSRRTVSRTVTVASVPTDRPIPYIHRTRPTVSRCITASSLLPLPTHSQNDSASLKLKLAIEKQNANYRHNSVTYRGSKTYIIRLWRREYCYIASK